VYFIQHVEQSVVSLATAAVVSRVLGDPLSPPDDSMGMEIPVCDDSLIG
jgi:hypothetical protein